MKAENQITSVLVIGDDREISSFLESSLSVLGFEVVLTNSAMQALEQVRSRDFDVILCEFKMPRLGGEELYAEMERHMPWALPKVCFLISDHNVYGTHSFLNRTDARFLEKPFTFDELAGVINDILNQH